MTSEHAMFFLKYLDFLHCSFPWIAGDYGVARPTNEMPYIHLFLEVDQSKKDHELLKQEIDAIFQWKASRYIELRFIDPSDEVVIKPLSKTILC